MPHWLLTLVLPRKRSSDRTALYGEYTNLLTDITARLYNPASVLAKYEMANTRRPYYSFVVGGHRVWQKRWRSRRGPGI